MAVAVHTNKMGATALSLGAPKRGCDACQLQGRRMIMSIYGRNHARPSKWCDGDLSEAPKRVCDAYQLQGRYVRVLVYMAASQRPLVMGMTALSLLRRQSEYAMHTSFKADVCA